MEDETNPGLVPRERPVLLFDVMQTLVHEPFYEEVPAFFGMTLDELLGLKRPEVWPQFECGSIEEDAFLDAFFSDGRRFDRAAFQSCMQSAYRWLDGMQDLMRDLHVAGHAIHALSNYPIWYRWIEERLGLGRYLEWTFVSCHTGLRKPDPQAFLGPARSLGVAPRDCLFVDDSEENCAAAQALGMAALRFRGASSLRVELAERGLLA
jgi:HAD superfamily hydrolase (TIGR01509 family)